MLHVYRKLAQVLATRPALGLRQPAPAAGALLLWLAVPGLALAQAGRPARPAAGRTSCAVVASAQPATLTLDASGAATLDPAALDNGSTACGTPTLSASRTSFGCADLNPAALPAVRRGSLQLDRANSQYVLSNNQVSGTTTGTFETWVKTTVAMPQFSGILVTSTAAGDAASGTGIYLRWDGGGRVACEGAWSVAQTGSSPALHDGQWHHIAAVGDGSTCKLYIDGVLNATGTATANAAYSRRIMLGAERSRAAGYFGTVELDNSRVWSVPRTPAQIQDGMAYETLANTYGLLLSYTYDNGSGITVRDVSGNNRPARLYSGTSTLPTFTAAGGVPLLPRGVPVTLTVTDTDGTTSTADTYVTVLPATPPATALSLSGSSVPENSAVGTVVGTLAFNPGACPSAGVTFELVPAAGTDYARFSLGTGANAGKLLLAAVPDYETQSSYTLRLRATDQNYATVDLVATIAVEDLIELSGTQTAVCGSAGATATVAVAGTATGYAYSWSPAPGGGQGTATATGLVAGTYTVSVSKTGLATATRDYVIVNDAILPVAQAKNVTLTLDASGTATLAAATLDDGSTDNCGIAGRSVSRNAFTCADLNPPVLPATRKGSLQLDRANSQYVLSNNQVSGTTTGTFETWVKTTVAMPQFSGILVTSTAPGDAASGTGIFLRWDGGGRVACEGAWAVAQTGSSPALHDGQWHHIAAVGDGSTCKLYIDGVLNATGTAASGQSYSRRIMLGAERSRAAGYFGTVELDNSRVWSVARTQAQIQESFTYEWPADTNGLLLSYAYDNGAGSTVRDASGSNQPATLYSGTATLPTFAAAGGAPLVPRGVPVTLTVTDAAGNASSASAYVTVQAPASAVAAARTWTGAKNTDWADCANWSYGLVPDASTNVSIPAGLNNYPALSGTNITVANLNVATGASIAMGTTVLSVTGDLLNAGPALSGPVRLLGAATQTLAGSLSSLTIDKTGGTTALAANVDVSTALFLTNGRLSTNSYTLTLGSGAMLLETDANYITGTVQTTRDLSGAGTSYDIGGLGLTLSPAAGSTAVPGRTLVQRVTGSPRSGVNGAASIARYFTITPTVDADLNVDLKLSYRTAELNGIAPASLGLFKSETGASGSWVQQTAAVINTSDKTATLAGVSSFSVWTLGTTAQPMPVVLTDFAATAQGREAVRLTWATASEKNSARFEVERSADGHSYYKVGSVAAAGTSTAAHTYALLDAALPTGAAVLYYRLHQIDQDGTATYSPVRSVALAGAAAGLSVHPNPATTGATLLGALPGTLATVLDALGRPVATATADATGKALLTLPAGLTPGVYVVRAGAQALRLVVE